MRFTFDLHDINASLIKSGQYEVQVRVGNTTTATVTFESGQYEVNANDLSGWTETATNIGGVKHIIGEMRRYYRPEGSKS